MTDDDSMPLRPGLPWPSPGNGITGRDQGSHALYELLVANTPPSALADIGRQLRASAEALSHVMPPDMAFALSTAEVAVLIARHRMADDSRRVRADLASALDTLATVLRRSGRADDADRVAGEASSVRRGAPMSPQHVYVANDPEPAHETPREISAPSTADILAVTVRIAEEFTAGRTEFVRRLADDASSMARQATENREEATALAEAGVATAHVAEEDGAAALRSLRTAAGALQALRRVRHVAGEDARAAEFRRVAAQWVAIAAMFVAKRLEKEQRVDDARLALTTVLNALDPLPGNRDDAERLRIELLRHDARMHSARGRHRRAVRAINEAVRRARPIEGVGMADLLAEQAGICAAAGRPADSTQAHLESHAERVRTTSDPHMLAYSALNLAIKLCEARHHEEAWTAVTEAVDGYRALVRESRMEFLPDLALCLQSAAGIAARLGLREEVAAMSREQCDIYRELTRSWPSYGVELALACTRYLLRAEEADREEVTTIAREAIEHYREVAGNATVVRTHDVVTGCQVLASLLGDGGFDRLEQEAWALYHRAKDRTG